MRLAKIAEEKARLARLAEEKEKKIAAEKAAAAKLKADRLAKYWEVLAKEAEEAQVHSKKCTSIYHEAKKTCDNFSHTHTHKKVVVVKRKVVVKTHHHHVVVRKTVVKKHNHGHMHSVHVTHGSCKGSKAHDMRMGFLSSFKNYNCYRRRQ